MDSELCLDRPSMPDITCLLENITAGDTLATGRLLSLVYDELRLIAAAKLHAERSDHTLQPTALVHEAYLRLFARAEPPNWQNRGHFFSAAADAMRRILVDWARAKKCQKRGGSKQQVEVVLTDVPAPIQDVDGLLDLDERLGQLAQQDRQAAELVKLRVFAGLSITEAGQALGMSRATAYENWRFARCWFACSMH
jgi:RNA polymerase sigma factor (TIGR02999 family)